MILPYYSHYSHYDLNLPNGFPVFLRGKLFIEVDVWCKRVLEFCTPVELFWEGRVLIGEIAGHRMQLAQWKRNDTLYCPSFNIKLLKEGLVLFQKKLFL